MFEIIIMTIFLPPIMFGLGYFLTRDKILIFLTIFFISLAIPEFLSIYFKFFENHLFLSWILPWIIIYIYLLIKHPDKLKEWDKKYFNKK